MIIKRYYFRPKIEVVRQSYLENAQKEYPVSGDDFNAILVVEAQDEDSCQLIRSGITDITMWEMIDPETGEALPHNLKNPEPWQ